MVTLIDFYADWCGPCHVMKPILDKVIPTYSGKLTFEKIDVDKDQSRAQQFGVMSIPTLVMLKNGQEVDRKIGLVAEGVLKEWIDSKI